MVGITLQPEEEEDTDGFALVTGFSKKRCNQLQPVQTGNKFQVLNKDDEQSSYSVEKERCPLGQGVSSPAPNG